MTAIPYQKFTHILLFFLLLSEGFVILAYELLALRYAIPFAGAGAPSAAIIISAVLLPLAAGYHIGGIFRPRPGRSVRGRLLFNLSVAAPFLVLGSSFIFLELFFAVFTWAGLSSPLLQLAFYGLLLVAPPVFFLGQTVPLIASYFRKMRSGQATGYILLVSTLGSLAGALLTTLVIMPVYGTHRVSVLLAFLPALGVLLLAPGRRRSVRYAIPVFMSLLAALYLNAGPILSRAGIVSNNQYHTAEIRPLAPQGRMLVLNKGSASAYDPSTGKKWEYVEFVEDNFVFPAARRLERPLDILVVGAGGFTLGADDLYNNYVFIDIDPGLQKVAEDHLLKKKLQPNKVFLPIPARRFLSDLRNSYDADNKYSEDAVRWEGRQIENDKAKTERGGDGKYDLIFIDVFNGATIPDHLVTVEFFASVKEKLRQGGAVVANIIASPAFQTAYSRNIYASFSHVFWPTSRQVLGNFDGMAGIKESKHTTPWRSKTESSMTSGSARLSNIMHIYFDVEGEEDAVIYTDMKNKAILQGP